MRTKPGCTFEHVVGGVPGPPPPINITVDLLHQTENQSIQFLATCTPLVPDINCEDLTGHDYGDVDVEACSNEQTWTITNEGSGPLLGSVWLEGTDPEEFEFLEGAGDFTLAPAESHTVRVRFCPASVGSKSAVLHIASNDPDENPCDLPVTGNGIGVPNINCEDLTDFDFGAIVEGLCSGAHTWLVVNEGTATLTGSVSLAGANPGQFELTQGGGAFDLDPGETRTVGIRFCPDSVGNPSAQLQIDSNDPDEDPCLRTLLGQGIPPNEPEINCEDLMPFDYGSKTVGFCTSERTWLLINEGMADLTGTILLAGPDAVEFEFTRGGGGFSLPAGAQRVIGVRFCPQTVGAKSAVLQIDSNDGDENPCVVDLSGTGGECATSRDLETLWPAYCDGDVKPVVLHLYPPGGAVSLALEDDPPAGWTATNISDGGYWDSIHQKVKWGPFFYPFPTQLSYDAEPPAGTQGAHCFDGIVSVNGIDYDVCGDACVDGPAGAFLPADEPQPVCPGCADCSCGACEDRQVIICEMSGYACAWRQGCNDDLAGMTRSATIWTSGECYCWGWDDDVQQLWWAPAGCPPSGSGCCGQEEWLPAYGGGSADRQLPASGTAGNWLTVTVDIQPAPGVSAVALEDQPPAGWTVQSISDNGVWDAVHGKVKWGPFFDPNIPAQVSYELLPPGSASGAHPFQGTISFDGINQAIDGPTCVWVGTLGDADHDLDVDLHDYGALQGCFGEIPACGACAVFDFDQADDVDVDDYLLWSQTLTGPGA